MAELGHHESIAALLRGIFDDLRQLMREEVELARVEIRQQAGRARLAAISLGLAAISLALGGFFLLVAAAFGIADLLSWPAWAGFLAIALLLSLGGAIMLATGRRKLRSVRAIPEQTVESMKENSEWIAKRLSSSKR